MQGLSLGASWLTEVPRPSLALYDHVTEHLPVCWQGSLEASNGETCWPAGAVRDAPPTIWAAPPGCANDRPPAFSASGRRFSTLSQCSLFKSSTSRFLLRASESRRRWPRLSASVAESAPSSRIQTCFLACCNSTWTEKFGHGDALSGILPTAQTRSSSFPAGDRSSAAISDAGKGRASRSTPVHSAAPTARTDLNCCASAGWPSSAWMRRSRSPIHFRTAAFGPSNLPARNTGYA